MLFRSYHNLLNVKITDIFDLGKKLRYYECFSKGANVNFYDVIGDNQLVVRTFERGVEDFTLACGTGSGSTVAIAALANIVDGNKTVEIDVLGGKLYIDVNIQTISNEKKVTELYLSGETKVVYNGIIDYEI